MILKRKPARPAPGPEQAPEMALIVPDAEQLKSVRPPSDRTTAQTK